MAVIGPLHPQKPTLGRYHIGASPVFFCRAGKFQAANRNNIKAQTTRKACPIGVSTLPGWFAVRILLRTANLESAAA